MLLQVRLVPKSKHLGIVVAELLQARCPSRMPFLLPNQQYQSTERWIYHGNKEEDKERPAGDFAV